VESHIAMQLLEFPTVWIRQEALAGTLERQETIARMEAEEQERLAAEAARQAEEQSMVVGDIDLAKLTSAQLATLVEGEDLGIEKQGAKENVGEFRVRVRDAMKAKLAAGQGGE
jgi:siroheme synthase (precorrin-2 oxidase/ferrochelatase)